MNYGVFRNEVVTTWLTDDPKDPGGDDRMMQLVTDFYFTDSNGLEWKAPANAKIDGASIPRPVWFWISPFIGDYRRASVLHDHYCESHERSWRATHRMFYDAMRADGTSEFKARVMYAAVYAYARRWPDPQTGAMARSATELDRLSTVLDTAPAETDQVWAQISERDFERIVRWVEVDEPDIDAIEARIDAAAPHRLVAYVAPALLTPLLMAPDSKPPAPVRLSALRAKSLPVEEAKKPAKTGKKKKKKAGKKKDKS